MGTGATYIVVMSTTSRWFDKKRGLALGIVGSGTGLGTLLVAPFATYLISSLGWRVAYIIMGLIAWVVVIPLSRLLKKSPVEIEALPDGVKSDSGGRGIGESSRQSNTRSIELTLSQAFRTGNFWFLGAIWLLYAFCYLMLVTHLVPHATDIGIPVMEAAGILSLIGGSNVVGRLLMGRVSDSIGRKATAITCALLVVGAMILLIRSQDLWMLYLFGIVCGFSFGGLDPAITALIGDIFGLRSIGIIMGTLNVAWGIGSAIGPAAGGFVFDIRESYFVAFLAGALAMLLVAMLVALTRREGKGNVR